MQRKVWPGGDEATLACWARQHIVSVCLLAWQTSGPVVQAWLVPAPSRPSQSCDCGREILRTGSRLKKGKSVLAGRSLIARKAFSVLLQV